MIQLVPLEETVAGQELICIGAEQGKKEGRKLGLREGKKEGIQKGRLIGEIRMGQRILGEPVSAAETLAEMDMEALEKMLCDIETKLGLPLSRPTPHGVEPPPKNLRISSILP